MFFSGILNYVNPKMSFAAMAENIREISKNRKIDGKGIVRGVVAGA